MNAKFKLSLLLIGIIVAFYCIYATLSDQQRLKQNTFVGELHKRNNVTMSIDFSELQLVLAQNYLFFIPEGKSQITSFVYGSQMDNLYKDHY